MTFVKCIFLQADLTVKYAKSDSPVSKTGDVHVDIYEFIYL